MYKKLIESGKINSDEITVMCITGNGLKTQEALSGHTASPHFINQIWHLLKKC